MAFSKDNLLGSAERLWQDAFRAGSRYDLAWMANELEGLSDKLHHTYEAHAYQTIFNSLIFESAMSLLRLLDKQRGTASIPNFLRASGISDVRGHILSGVAAWPMHRMKSEAKINHFVDAEIRTLMLDYFLLRKFESSLKLLRNKYLAHSKLEGPKGSLPSFADLNISTYLAELCSDRVYLLCTGTSKNVNSYRRAHKKFGKSFWNTFLIGLSCQDRTQID